MGIRPCDKSISFRGYETPSASKKNNVFEANYSSDHPVRPTAIRGGRTSPLGHLPPGRLIEVLGE